MAEVRKSAKLTAARTQARENAAQFREREGKLEAAAIDYFTYVEQIEDAHSLAEKEVARIREQAAANVVDRKRSASAAIARMLDLGVSRGEVAQRLGIATRDVPRAAPGTVTAVKNPTQDEPADETTNQESAAVA